MTWCWHKWEKWSRPFNGIYENVGYLNGSYGVMQMRECTKCGVMQTRRLPTLRSIDDLRKEK